jgi:beta-fructofuranosidase
VIDHRPQAHLRPATGWMNDPTGPVRWHGRVHLFHQHNPDGGYWDRPHWAHLVSDDLVRWQRRPIALSPAPTGPDEDGCYSGCVVIDGDEAVMVYTGARGEPGPSQIQTTCLARSRDPWLDRWDRDATNPVTTPPGEHQLLGFRDPFVWRENDVWWQMVGAGIEGVGGAALLFRSDDLLTWTEVGPMLTGEELSALDASEWTGAMWECPALLRGPDGDALIISVHDESTTHHPLVVTGRLEGHRFVPHAMHRIDLGPDVYAPCVLAEDDGSAIMWAWSWEARSAEQQRSDGWAGTLTSPRRVKVVGDRLLSSPLHQLTSLRDRELEVAAVPSQHGWLGTGVRGDALDLELELGPAADRIELRLLCSPDGEEVTTVTVDRPGRQLWLDRERASMDPSAFGGRYGGQVSDEVDLGRLRVIVDRSIVEVFVDDQITLTARVYPTRQDSRGVEVVGTPGAVADVRMRAWTLGSIWTEPDTSPTASWSAPTPTSVDEDVGNG